MLDVSQPGALQKLYRPLRARPTAGEALHGAQRPLPRAGGLYRRQAGVPGAVTVATNMAGRGTDIQLGGNVDMRVEN